MGKVKGWNAFRPGEWIDLNNIEDLKALAAHRRSHLTKVLENATIFGHKKRAAPEPESQCGPSHFSDGGCATTPNQPDR